MIPIKNRIEHIFTSDLYITSLLTISLNIFGIIIFNLFSLSVQVKSHLLICYFAVIHMPEFLSLGHFSLLCEKVQLWFSLLFELFHAFFIFFVVFHKNSTLVCKIVQLCLLKLSYCLKEFKPELVSFFFLLLREDRRKWGFS